MSLAVVACLATITTTIPTILAPASAGASPERETLQDAIDIEIDGSPVTVELDPGETALFTYDYDGFGRVLIEILDCPNGEFLTDYYLQVQVSILEAFPVDGHRLCGVDDQVHGPFAPAGPSGNWFDLKSFASETLSFTLRLNRVPESSDPITLGQPVAAELPYPSGNGIPNETARWFHFSGVEGQAIRFVFRDWEECPAVVLRYPDLTTTTRIGGFCGESEDEWPTFILPQTGAYRVELSNFWLWQDGGLNGTVELTVPDVSPTCSGAGVRPIMLVHGFNGDPGDWNSYRPLLVDRLAQEFVASGVGQQEAAICADTHVYAVALGPRDNSYVNGSLLLDEIRDLLDRTGAEDIDIIAHSKGGLDSRRAIQLLGAEASAVRNLVMIATPNRGTFLADVACALHNLRWIEGLALQAVSAGIESAFGPCRGPEDALHVITEDFVLKSFNQIVIDRPEVAYHSIAGDSSCFLCRLTSVLISGNDGLVPVLSAHRLLPASAEQPYKYHNLGTFDLEHNQYQVTEEVLDRAYCSLVGRQPNPAYCAAEPDQQPSDLASTAVEDTEQVEEDGHLAHLDGLELQGDASESATLPIGGIGAAGIAVISDQESVTVTADGVQFDAEDTVFGRTLSAEVDTPADIELTVSNTGSEPTNVMILVFGTNDDGLAVEVTPDVAAPAEPIELRVPGAGSLTGLHGVVSGSGDGQTELVFTAHGSDAVASFTPSASGDHLVTVLQDGERRTVAFGRFVVGDGAASLPGSFTESLDTGSDGLAGALNLDVDAEVSEPGTYRLTGVLTTEDGIEAAAAETSAELAQGQQQLRLTVPGPTLYAVGEDGPYFLTLTLLRTDPAARSETIEAQVTPAALTQPYQASDFRPATIETGYVSLEQGNFETTVVEVPVTLSEPITRPAAVTYTSLNLPGEQYAHSPEDFDAVAGTLTFVPGETTKTIPVTINGNPDQEGNRLAVIEFTDPTNAVLGGNGQGGVAILAEPTAVIDTPAVGVSWSTGEEISFSGHVSDPVDGVLPAPALSWRLRLEHCPAPPDPGGCHSHVLQEWNGVAEGSFVAPDHGYPAHLELELTAQGPSGLAHNIVREIHPNTVEITLASDPPGRLLAAGFPPAAVQRQAPFTVTAIQGSTVLLGALDHQDGGIAYVFQRWSQGGEAIQSIQAPTVSTTYTATFATDVVIVDPPSAANGEYAAVAAAFGSPPDEQGIGGGIALANDGGPRPTEGCNPLVGFPSGAVALMDRGTCPFTQKVRNAQNAGAVAVIVVNNAPGDAFEMGGIDPTIVIPSVMVSLEHGDTIKAGLPATGSVARVIPTDP